MSLSLECDRLLLAQKNIVVEPALGGLRMEHHKLQTCANISGPGPPRYSGEGLVGSNSQPATEHHPDN
jgi:hypothetical protein